MRCDTSELRLRVRCVGECAGAGLDVYVDGRFWCTAAVLATLRQAHPGAPIVCITPIFSSREWYSDEYEALSRHTRIVVRESVAERVAQGDDRTFLVEGEGLLSPQDSDGLSGDGVHPNDLGHSRIAERLRPTIEAALRRADDSR